MIWASPSYCAMLWTCRSAPFNRKGRIAGLLLPLFLSVSLYSRPGWGQTARPAAPQVKVNLGTLPTLAGGTVDVPVYFSAPEAMKIASLTTTISFPRKLLSFTKAELGIMGQQSQAELQTGAKDDNTSADLSLLQLTVSSKESMKQGILAYLKFDVSVNATKGKIPLNLVDFKAVSSSGVPVSIAKGMDGAIEVYNTTEEMPVVGCFFFSH